MSVYIIGTKLLENFISVNGDGDRDRDANRRHLHTPGKCMKKKY